MTDQELDDLLVRCGGKVKLALIVAEKGLSIEESRLRLEMAQGVLAKILAHEEEKEASKHQVNGFKHHRPVLCVDGGGSKCAAVVGFPGGKTVKAVAGPCNL